ncbi:putative transcription factor AS2-LOB family [Dioscorea sansibarensis]
MDDQQSPQYYVGQEGVQMNNMPCAGCRKLHRRCNRDCVLAPYFPANEPEKFAGVHKVFGASNVIKMLLGIEQERREDAVESLVYEAFARLKDPVYGCTGTIVYLQNYVKDLQGQLKATQDQRDQLINVIMNENTTIFDDNSNFIFNNNSLCFSVDQF